MTLDIEYRPATSGDLELLMAWRSHPKLYKSFHEQDSELTWGDHINWWESRSNRRDWIIVVKTGSRWRDVGVVALSELDKSSPEISIWIGETTLWGNGAATAALNFVLRWLRDEEYPNATARVLKSNSRSQELFKREGFELESSNNTINEYQITL